MEELPVTVTKYGLPICVIYPLSFEQQIVEIAKRMPNKPTVIGVPELPQKISKKFTDSAPMPHASIPVTLGEEEDVGPTTFKLCKAKFCGSPALEGSDFCKEHKHG